MFIEIFLFELRYWLKKPSIYFYSLVFGGMLFFVMLGSTGYFDDPLTNVDVQIPRWLNSPFEIGYLLAYFNKFFLFLLPAIIGATIYRDFQNGASRLIYSFAIGKKQYLSAKFLSSFFIVSLITFFALICTVLAELILGLKNINIGPFNPLGYAMAYFFMVFLNLLFYGLLVFIVVALFRNIYAGFVLVLVLFLLQIIIENLFSSQPYLIGLLDPFAQNAVMYETADWTQLERNILRLPVQGMLFYNRLFWFGFISIIGFIFFKKFTFSYDPIFNEFFASKKIYKNESVIIKTSQNLKNLPLQFNFSFIKQLRTMWAMARFDCIYILKNWMFVLFLAFGIFAILFAVGKATNFNELTLLPLTRLMLAIPLFFFSTIITIITIVFSGMIIHRSRSVGINELEDSSPTNGLVFLGAKFLALTKIQILLLFIMVACGISIQLSNGYYNFEFGLYFRYIFTISLPPLIIWTCLCLLTHTVFKNVYLSIFLLILVWMGKDQLNLLGIDTHLIAFNSTSPLSYNDMNGFGHGLRAFTNITGYWLSWSVVFIVFTTLLWTREYYFSLSERLAIAKKRLSRPHIIVCILACVAFLSFGFIILKEETQLQYNKEDKSVMKNFQVEFKQFKNTPQPSILNIDLKLDLNPEVQGFQATGQYKIINRHAFPIDTILIKTGYDENTEISLNRKSRVLLDNKALKYQAILLDRPLFPGDSIELYFTTNSRPNSILERNSSVLENGTFLMQDILPRLGYFFNDKPALPTDPGVRQNNFYAPDADFVSLSTIISTTSNQTAIAPGKLIESWKEKDRNYYRYQTMEKIKLSFAFMSGRYTVRDTAYAGKTFKIFYHPTHAYNTDNILAGMQKAIDYNTAYFNLYQHEDVKIIEYPLSEGTLATAMGNIMPMSEQRFILNPDTGNDKIDLAFYVPAHELTHHWWGNQVIPADALGARMLTESITEYVTLQIYQDHYGSKMALQFLEVQHNRYLKGRTRERNKENPLALVEPDQDYIAYGKGAIAFNTLSHYLGELKFNAILKLFLEKYHSKKVVYPTSLDLIDHLNRTVPETYKYLIDDYFQSMTIYENSLINIDKKQSNSLFQVSVDFEINKKYLEKTENPSLNDWIEIGFTDENGEIFKIEKVLVTKVENNLKITLTKKPYSIILDPNLLMIDKNRSKYKIAF